MKFLSDVDAQTFLAEVGSFDKIAKATKDYQPTNEEMKGFIKSRSSLVKKLKNSKQSSDQKANWRKNRYKMMKGIKAFHKSTEGKRFHKRLGRFLATRIIKNKEKTNESYYQDLLVKQYYLKGLNSAKSHLFVELEYFHQLEEQVDLELFIIEHAIPMFTVIENTILEDSELCDDQITFLFDILEEDVILDAFETRSGKEFAQIKKLWNSIVSDLNKKKVIYESEEYYISILPKLIKFLEK